MYGEMPRGGQKGPQYPDLSKDKRPLQVVRDLYRQPQEAAYKMDMTPFMPEINNTSTDGRATTRQGGMTSGDQNSSVREKSFSAMDTASEHRAQKMSLSQSFEATEGRK